MHRDFLWRGNANKRKVNLINWAEVSNPKEEGGLGIIPLRIRHYDLLCKWSWKFGRETWALWRKLLVARYRVKNDGGWFFGDRMAREGYLWLRAYIGLGMARGE